MRLHNRGFRKYVLIKLFRYVTYAQEITVKMEPSPLHPYQPLTLQQAERRIITVGEDLFIFNPKGTGKLPLQPTKTLRSLEGTSHQTGIASTLLVEIVDFFQLFFTYCNYYYYYYIMLGILTGYKLFVTIIFFFPLFFLLCRLLTRRKDLLETAAEKHNKKGNTVNGKYS